MGLLRKIKAPARIQLYVNIAFSSIFIIVAIIYIYEKKFQIEKEISETAFRDMDELLMIVENQMKRDKDLLNQAVNIAEFKINDYADIEPVQNVVVPFPAIDPYTNEPVELNIDAWKIDGSDLINNYRLADNLKKLTNADVSIYQKCDKGYVNVSTSIVNAAGERLTGDIILHSSSIAKAVEAGLQYTARIRSKSAWYVVSYKPLFVDGKILGIYFIGLRERMGAILKPIFEKRRYLASGYPFILTDNGSFLVHPTRTNEDISSTMLYKTIMKHGRQGNTFRYKWPETGKSQQWILYYKYHEATRSFICITFKNNELQKPVYLNLIIAVIAYLIFIVVLHLIILFANKSFNRSLKKYKVVLNKVLSGEALSEFDFPDSGEFGDISALVRRIAERNHTLSVFAKGLVNDNFSQPYPKSFSGDELGESLIRINDKLNEAMYNEHIRQKEDKLRNWESEGLSKFVSILQRNRDNLDELCYEVISSLVEYLNANLGALFFLDNTNPNDIHFKQMATYAFQQKKLINKRVYPDQGLIGRVFNEKHTIYLSEIPEGYISIVSGLGNSAPKNLLIVPLFINNEVYGAVEIASFNIIKGYQIEFIEKIGENIASTINNVLVNNKTRELLSQSRAQSELLSAQEEKMRKNLLELKNIQIEAEAGSYEMKDSFKIIEGHLLMVELNAKGDISAINSRVADFFGMEKATLIGKHYSDYSNFIPVDEYKVLINSWEKLLKGIDVQIQVKVKSGSGQVKNVLLNMCPQMQKSATAKILIFGTVISDTYELEGQGNKGL